MKKASSLLKSISHAATALRKAARWKGSVRSVDIKNDDFLYELFCYFKVALAAKQGFQIRLAGKLVRRGNGRLAAQWPRKPGDKVNFSYLALHETVVNNKEVFQLCPGINIRDKFNKFRALDINLLHGSTGAEPSYQDLDGIWDAKYLTNSASRLPDTQVSDFAYTFRHLGSPVIPSIWIAATKKPELQRSGILTNGKRSTEKDNALEEEGISETEQFPHNPTTRP